MYILEYKVKNKWKALSYTTAVTAGIRSDLYDMIFFHWWSIIAYCAFYTKEDAESVMEQVEKYLNLDTRINRM